CHLLPSPRVLSSSLLLSTASTLFPYTTLFRSRSRRQRSGTSGREARQGAVRQGSHRRGGALSLRRRHRRDPGAGRRPARDRQGRSEEHTSELQSRFDLVCRLLLEKKKLIRLIV